MTLTDTIKNPQSENAVIALIICIVTGVLGMIFFGFQASHVYEFLSIFGVGLFIAGASLLFGALLGFLFGIPRTLQQDKPEKKPPNGGDGNKEQEENGTSYRANTNLEQISDWLTKILVGIGLTQIGKLPALLQKYAKICAPGLGSFPSSNVFAIGILFFYIICGFLISYLWTRLYFAGALRKADLDSLGDKLTKVENRVSEIQRQTEIDAKALNIVQHQLNPGPGAPQLPQEELNNVISPASQNVKTQIYYIAHGVRSQNWRNRETKPLMERTIPVFRALIASDKDDIYHLNHGQLAFALKDQRNPDWKQAEAELSKAIQLRGSWETEGWLFYEFNRAICRISLDSEFAKNEKAAPDVRNIILADIETAKKSNQMRKLIEEDPLLTKWLSLNKKGKND